MSKKTSMRLPAATVDQLQWLAEHRFGDNQTTAMVVAVDRLYRDESKDMCGFTLRHAVQEALQHFRGWMDGAVVVRTRGLRRLTRYAWEYQAAGGGPWQPLDALAAGQPRPVTWRVPLPGDAAGGRLRWLGPCPLQPARSCVLALADARR